MSLVLQLLAAVSLLELLLWLKPLHRVRKPLSWIIIIGVAVLSGLAFGVHPALWTALIVCISLYRIVGLLRVLEDRTHPDRLYRNGWRTSLVLIGLQLLVLVTALVVHRWQITTTLLTYCVVGVQLLGAAIVWTATKRSIKASWPSTSDHHYSDHELPTVTIAIPARNETDDLEACLQSLSLSDYPKLEVLVLDDCSQERRTPEIIRGFAHDGVRFIAGKAPPEKWLAKNYAYQQLAATANGQIILFCGVDVRFSQQTVRHLVENMLERQSDMISVMPSNEIPHADWRPESWLVQPSRYAWELALPRRWLRRPPVLSTCWLIKRQTLSELGTFAAVTHSSSPESYFARRLGAAYRFIWSDSSIQLVCQKSVLEQRATATRIRYPQLHRRPELVAVVAAAECVVLLLPLVVMILVGLRGDWLLMSLTALSALLQCWAFGSVVSLTFRRVVLRGYFSLPLAVVYDLVLLHVSMWRYEFGSVIWKDRNVCLPLMQVIPSLPKS